MSDCFQLQRELDECREHLARMSEAVTKEIALRVAMQKAMEETLNTFEKTMKDLSALQPRPVTPERIVADPV